MARRAIRMREDAAVMRELGERDDEVWILGATGRSGRAIASRLVGAPGVTPVLVGRHGPALDELARTMGGDARTLVAASVDAMAVAIERARPAVVINTIGPFTATALTVARACLAGSHYADLANDLESSLALLGLHDAAVAAGRTLVTGAGFGVLATESVVVALCDHRPTPAHVRVDALPSVDGEAGVVGAALAASLVDGVAGGGRRYADGRLVPARVGGDAARLTLPDGSIVTTSAVPTGELHAAWLASGAPSVTAASGLLPDSRAVRVALPIARALLSVKAVRGFVTQRLARMRTPARPRSREHSFGHACVTWPDGTGREGWLRAGEAMEFTAGVMAECAVRLARSDAAPGAYTPAAAFGHELATAAGGEFVLD